MLWMFVDNKQLTISSTIASPIIAYASDYTHVYLNIYQPDYMYSKCDKLWL